MLALVKTPRTETELCIHGESMEIITCLRRFFKVEIIGTEKPDQLIDANSSEYDRANRFRLLPGYRIKAGMTQKQLAEKSGIRQNLISDYETGRRRLTPAAAAKLAPALNISPDRLLPLD